MRTIFKTLGILLGILGGLLVWYDQSRSFFQATNGEYITMWKRYGGTCYLIPGKYYGIIKPKDGYVEMSNRDYLTIYFSNRLPNMFLLKKESEFNYKAINPINDFFFFEDYILNKERYEPIIYKKHTNRFIDINKDASLLNINILEGYATDETGKTQR